MCVKNTTESIFRKIDTSAFSIGNVLVQADSEDQMHGTTDNSRLLKLNKNLPSCCKSTAMVFDLKFYDFPKGGPERPIANIIDQTRSPCFCKETHHKTAFFTNIKISQ